MVTKKQSRVPGRPRRFAPEQAVSAAKVLFHQKGFDAVSVAEVTDYLGINPPSLYAAFGSKAGLFSRVLNEYVGTEAIPLADILRDDRPVGECLAEVLKEAARRYSQNGGCAGCMVLEGMLHRNKPIRVLRDDVVVFQGELESLRRYKEVVEEVRAGMECGLAVKGYKDIKVQDKIEVYDVQLIKRSL